MIYQRYPRYNSFNINWLGEIPEHWSVKKLKYVKSSMKNSFVDGPFGSNLKTEHFMQNSDVYVIESEFATRGKLNFNELKTITFEHFITIRRSETQTGDIIIAKIGAYFGLNNILPEIEKPAVVSGNSMKLTIGSEYNVKFVHYMLLYLKWCGAIDIMVSTTAQPALSLSEMNHLSLAAPPLSEQKTIAAFLDYKTAQIDNLIAEKERLLKLLEEKRIALITQAVTKGLDPNVRMKPSGIDWLGDIPEHWEVKRLKQVSTLVGRIGFRGYSTEDIVDEMEGAITLSPSNMANGILDLNACTYISWEKFNESPEIQIKADDIILVKTGSTIGKVAFVGEVTYPMTINPQIAVFKNIMCLNKYLFYYLISSMIQDQFHLSNTGSTIPTMTQATIGRYPIPLPSAEEQDKIIAFLEREVIKIENLYEHILIAITKLKEYRVSLITSAVTGKIDVRDFKPEEEHEKVH